MIIAAYTRVSSDIQAEQGTIQSQIDLARAWITAQGHTPELYVDDGVTGMRELRDRPEGARLLADAAAHKFDRVIVYKLDRLGRGDDARNVLNAVYGLRDLGVAVVSLTESIDTSTPAGELFLTMLAGFASFDRKVFLERSRLGTERIAKMGKYVGGVVPYGYRVQDGYLVPSDDPIPGLDMSEVEVIRLIYRLSAEDGWSCIRIADYLHGLGVPTRYTLDGKKIATGKRTVTTANVWSAGRIRNMLVEPVYRGEHHFGRRSKKPREIIIRTVPALVSEETWHAAQQTLTQNRLDGVRTPVREYLLRGLLVCGTCGRRYTGTAMKAKGGEITPYYICGGKSLVYPGQPYCTSKNVPGVAIEEDIWQQVVALLTQPRATAKHLKFATPAPPGEAKRAREGKALSNALAANGKERERLIRAYRRGVITDEEFDAQVSEVDGQRAVLQRRQAELANTAQLQQAWTARQASAVQKIAEYRALLDQADTVDQRRQIVRAFVERITVHTHGKGNGRWHVTAEIEVHWKGY